jgi:replicative DNA helicase
MAKRHIELAFVGSFWQAVEAKGPERQEQAWRAMELVSDPQMLEDGAIRRVYTVLLDRFASGKPVDDSTTHTAMVEAGGTKLISELLDCQTYNLHILRDGERIQRSAKAREQVQMLQASLEEAKRAVHATDESARRVGADLATNLLTLHGTGSEDGAPQRWSDQLDAELADMEREEAPGITLPWPKLNDLCGPWMPGDLIGVSAYSGGGKSTFAANLAAGFARRGVPVIAFPTEMRAQWIRRMLAAEAGIPHKLAEKRQWKKLTPEQDAAYRDTVKAARKWPIAVVNRGTITPAEVVAATRVLRRRWDGQTVVVLIDHAHRLDYGSEKPEEAVGRAAKLWKNFAGDDTHGGMVVVSLFQPRKPEIGKATHGPVAGYQIRGDSAVWNELDVHLSPYRAWVECLEHAETPWGTLAAKTDITKGSPKLAKPEAEGAKLDDEHVYLKLDKDRIAGEGPTVWLNFDYPTGRIFERWMEEVARAS